MNYYRLLGVSPQATPRDIKQAYRRLARQCHPDIAGENARERFLQISEAYRVLNNPLQRREYDRAMQSRARPARSSAVHKRPAQKSSVPPTFDFASPFDFDADTYAAMKQRVRSAYTRKEYAIAVKLADELALRFPGHPTAQHWIALTYQQRGRELLRYGQAKLARIYFEKAIAAPPRDRDLLAAIRRDLQQCKRSAPSI